MHYRNGREAKNGDVVIQFGADDGRPVAVGVLYDAQPGNDFCNGSIAPTQQTPTMACLCDCLHVEDVEALAIAAGLGKRPASAT